MIDKLHNLQRLEPASAGLLALYKVTIPLHRGIVFVILQAIDQLITNYWRADYHGKGYSSVG